MADRITQLQDLVMQQADNLWSSINVINKHAEPYVFPEIEKKPVKLSKEERRLKENKSVEDTPMTKIEGHLDYTEHFAKRMSGLASDINTVISCLPDDTLLNADLQVQSLRTLEETNEKLSADLDEEVLKADILLRKIRESSEFLSTSYLDIMYSKV